MAESIAIIFKDVSWDTLCIDLTEVAENDVDGKKHWRYPSANDDYTLSLYEYDSWLRECEPDEASDIKNQLGSEPSAILCIELRRSTQNKSCDHAGFIVVTLLEKYSGIADDAMEKRWNLQQIKEGDFLNVYRYNL